MDPPTGRLITLPKVYPYVMTKNFIKSVEKLSEYQGFKKLKTIHCKKKEIVFTDADILAGVYWVHNDNETDDIQEDENK